MFLTKIVFKKKVFKPDTIFIDAKGSYVAPGFIDTHIHGFGGFGTDDYSTESILKMSELLAEYGVTGFIPTLYSAPKKDIIKGR